jgi:deoxyribodipyrimidine photo-lyase
MPPNNPSVVHWFRRDLRLADNPAFLAAVGSGCEVIPLYVVSQWSGHHSWTGPKRQKFLCESLAVLSTRLEGIGGKLIIRKGEALETLAALLRQSGAKALYYNRHPDPHGRQLEAKVKSLCATLGVECFGFDDVSLHPPDGLFTRTGQPYRVFTPYYHSWVNLPRAVVLPPPPSTHTPQAISSEPLPTLQTWSLPEADAELLPGGELAANNRLAEALQRFSSYHEWRDFPSKDATSRLSQDLRFGLLSIRTVVAEAIAARDRLTSAKAKEGFTTFIKELAWRDFYLAILYHYPEVLEHEFNPDWRGLPWDEPGEQYEAWKLGRTGFPIVDAGMRQLLRTGFMHNRVRMITAMFLTKDLHLDWRLGESWFMQHLVDGEIASNNGGWQWSAGTGADAAPYFRIQNPWSQTKRYDPQGAYIRRWVPELKDVPVKKLMAPPADGRPLAPGYPLPIVDHAAERLRTLAIFKKHRASKPR